MTLLDLDADLVIALIADREIDAVDARIVLSIVKKRLSYRAAARELGLVPGTIGYRLRKMDALLARLLPGQS